jgi:hypothetical protein
VDALLHFKVSDRFGGIGGLVNVCRHRTIYSEKHSLSSDLWPLTSDLSVLKLVRSPCSLASTLVTNASPARTLPCRTSHALHSPKPSRRLTLPASSRRMFPLILDCRNSQFQSPASLPSTSPSSRKVGPGQRSRAASLAPCELTSDFRLPTSSQPLNVAKPLG